MIQDTRFGGLSKIRLRELRNVQPGGVVHPMYFNRIFLEPMDLEACGGTFQIELMQKPPLTGSQCAIPRGPLPHWRCVPALWKSSTTTCADETTLVHPTSIDSEEAKGHEDSSGEMRGVESRFLVSTAPLLGYLFSKIRRAMNLMGVLMLKKLWIWRKTWWTWWSC